MSAQTACRLFSLPPELQNFIYELSFTDNGVEGDPICVTSISPPSNSLITTCRLIHSESKNMYKHAFRCYFQTNTFAISSARQDQHEIEMAILNLREDDVRHMRNLLITAERHKVFHEIWISRPEGSNWTVEPDIAGALNELADVRSEDEEYPAGLIEVEKAVCGAYLRYMKEAVRCLFLHTVVLNIEKRDKGEYDGELYGAGKALLLTALEELRGMAGPPTQ